MKLAQYSINEEDDLGLFKPSEKEKLLIFCKSEFVESLIELVDGTQGSFVLIAGNSDRDFTNEIKGIEQAFSFSFLQNSLISDNKTIFTLPIGIENLRLGMNGLTKFMKPGKEWKFREKSVLVGPFSNTHHSRKILNDSNSFRQPLYTKLSFFVSPKRYAEISREHKYVLCPRGNGIDTHRFWETLYRGSIPIVFKDKWSESLLFHGFPFIQVEDFSHETINNDINKFEESNNFDSFDPLTTESLWIDYWVKLLRK